MPHSEIPGSKPARGSPGLFAACHVLHRLLAPRHPPDALAFLAHRQRQPQTPPHAACGFTGAPARRCTAPTKKGRMRPVLPEEIPATTTKGRPCEERPAYPCQMRALPTDGRDQEEGQNARLADARRARRMRDRSPMPADGHLITTSRCPNSKGLPRLSPRGGRERLVGLGRLERPTSRLSGVRSNQLSYRPKHTATGTGRPPTWEGRSGPAGKVAGEGTCRRRRAHDPRRPVKIVFVAPILPRACPRRAGPP